MNQLKRIEIIASNAIEDNLIELLAEQNLGSHFTKIPEVVGYGNSDPREGSSVWPETNFILIIYCNQDDVARIKNVVQNLKEQFPGEGIKMFVL